MADIESVQAPEALRALKQWLIWRMESNPNGPKPRKMPYYAGSGKRRSKNNSLEDINQLVGFSEAKVAAAKRGPEWGVGLAMVAGSPVTALDFDRCVTIDANGTPVVADEVDRMIVGTYAEISPSGTGVRAFISGALGNGRQAHHHDWDYGLELFNGTGFVTFTGNVTETTKATGDENTVAPPTAALLEHVEKRFRPALKAKKEEIDEGVFTLPPPRVGMTIDELRKMLENLDPNMGNKEWHDLGAALHHETEGSAEGCALWDEWSASGHGYPGTEYFEHRWEGFDSTKENAIRIVSYFKQAQEGAKARGQKWEIPYRKLVQPIGPVTGIKLHSRADLFSMAPIEWLVKKVLPAKGIAQVYGPSMSGKSFLMLDMACHIAEGREWFGYRVKQTPVVYAALEGEAGFRLRAEAWEKQNGRQIPEQFHMVLQAFRIDDPDHVAALIAVVPLGAMTIIDTQSRAAPTVDENSAKDMGAILEGAKAIADATGGIVVLVAHTGKDASKGPRGHSSQIPTMDAAIFVNRDKDVRTWKIGKNKEGVDGINHPFTLEVVTLGYDEDADEVSSCAVVEAGGRHASEPIPHGEGKGIDAYQRARESGEGEFDSEGQFVGLREKVWREKFYEIYEGSAAGTPDKHVVKPDTKRKAFNRAREALINSGRARVVRADVYRIDEFGHVWNSHSKPCP